MADNVAYTPGSGATIAADDIAGVLHQRVKLSLGADGSAADAPGDGTDGMLVNLGANNDVTVTGTVTANLAAGTNNIGDVDVLTLPGSLTGYAEDTAHSSGHIGLLPLAVRRDTEATSADTAGDYATLNVDANGRLYTTESTMVRSSATPGIGAALYGAGDVFGAALTFSNAALLNGGTGRIVNATLTNRYTETPLLELWLFRASPTLANADNGVFSITDANLEAADLLGVIEFSTYYATDSNTVSQGSYRGASLGAAPLHYVCGASATSIYGAFCIRNAVTPASTTDVIVTLTFERF